MTACESNEKNIGTALELYSDDHAGAYPRSLGELTPKYLKVIPTCPAAGQDTYSSRYQVAASPAAYSFFCQGTNHEGVGLKADFPQYTSTQGLVSGH